MFGEYFLEGFDVGCFSDLEWECVPCMGALGSRGREVVGFIGDVEVFVGGETGVVCVDVFGEGVVVVIMWAVW